MKEQIKSVNEVIQRAINQDKVASVNDILIDIRNSGCIWLYIKTIRNHTVKLTIFPDAGISCGLYGG